MTEPVQCPAFRGKAVSEVCPFFRQNYSVFEEKKFMSWFLEEDLHLGERTYGRLKCLGAG